MNFTPNFSGIINALKYIIENGIAGGGTTNGATATKQDQQTTELLAIKNRLPANGALSEGTDIDGTAIPTGGTGGRGWLSAIWKILNDKLPSTLINGFLAVIAEDPAPVEFTNSVAAASSNLISIDSSNYKFISVQISGTFVASYVFEQSNDGVNWFSTFLFITSVSSSIFSSTNNIPAPFAGYISSKFFRIRLNAYTSGTVNANILLYKKAPSNFSNTTLATIANVSTVVINNSPSVIGPQSHGGAIGSISPVVIGGNARSTNYTVVGNDSVARLVCSTVGALITSPFSIPENYIDGVTAAITGTADTAVITAGGTGTRNYITGGIVANSSATATLVEIKDGTTVKARVFAPANDTITFSFPSPLKGTGNTAINVANTTAGSNIFVTLTGYRAP